MAEGYQVLARGLDFGEVEVLQMTPRSLLIVKIIIPDNVVPDATSGANQKNDIKSGRPFCCLSPERRELMRQFIERRKRQSQRRKH